MVHSTFAQGHVAAGRETVSLGIPKSPSFHSGLDLVASASAESLKDSCNAFSRCSGGLKSANDSFCGGSVQYDEKKDEFLLNSVVDSEKSEEFLQNFEKADAFAKNYLCKFENDECSSDSPVYYTKSDNFSSNSQVSGEELKESSRNCEETNPFATSFLVQAANNAFSNNPSVCNENSNNFTYNTSVHNEKTDFSVTNSQKHNDISRNLPKSVGFSKSSSAFKFANGWNSGLARFEIPKQRNASAVRAMQLGGHLPALTGDFIWVFTQAVLSCFWFLWK